MSTEQTRLDVSESRASLRQIAGVLLGLLGTGEVAAFVGSLVQRDYVMAGAYGSFAVASFIEAGHCLSETGAETPIADQV